MDYKRKIKIRDDLPRFVSFKYGLFQPGGDSNAPVLRTIALPYQVQPNGRILCSQLLKVEWNWTPMAVDTVTGGATLGYFDRFVLDAVQNAATSGGLPVAWDSLTDGTEVARNPYSRPSVVHVVDRAAVISGTTAAAGAGGITYQNLFGEKDFGVNGEYPVIPSGQLGMWGFTLNSSATSALGNTFAVASTPHVPPYDRVCRPLIGDTVPGITSQSATSLCTEIRGRVWYRTVELEPYQHLMISNKFKSGSNVNIYTPFYDKTSTLTANPNSAGVPVTGYFGF